MKPGKWKPISTAPHDRVILTDCGTAEYFDDGYGSGLHGWYLMEIGGQFPPRCADEGFDVSRISPKWWMEIPELP